jgi:hypothetical protein
MTEGRLQKSLKLFSDVLHSNERDSRKVQSEIRAYQVHINAVRTGFLYCNTITHEPG